ncbi:hypothetical protein [Serratia fonticola]
MSSSLSQSTKRSPQAVASTDPQFDPERTFQAQQALLLRRLTEMGERQIVGGGFYVQEDDITGSRRALPRGEVANRLYWSLLMIARTPALCVSEHPTLRLFVHCRTLFPFKLNEEEEDARGRAAQLNNVILGFREAFRSPEHRQALVRYDRDQAWQRVRDEAWNGEPFDAV